MKERILTALVLAPIAIAGVLLLATPVFAACLGAIFAVGLIEWSRLIGLRAATTRVALVAANILLMGLIWQYRDAGATRIAIIVGAAFWLVALLWLRHFGFAAAPGRRTLGLKAFAGSLAVVPAWAAAVELHAIPAHGPAWMLFVWVLVWCADVSAFFAGRRFGRTKLAPRISPGKTIAGVWGALAGCAAFAALAGLGFGHQGVALAALVALSVVTVLFSIVGDLFESLIKRHSNVKDSGSVLPGHGGVFDRLDSLFAALPVFTAGKLWLGL